MDLDTVLMGLGMLVVFMAPVYFLVQSGKRKKKKVLTAFHEFAKSSGKELAEVTVLTDSYFLATDVDGKVVFYANTYNQESPYMKQDLAEVSNCRVSTEGHTVKDGGDSIRVIDRIWLQFESKQSKDVVARMKLYDADTDPSLSDQPRIGEEWQQKINNLIAKDKNPGK